MKLIDFHCDALYKLLLDDHLTFNNSQSDHLDVTYERLQAAGTMLQTFAIYIPPNMNGRIEPVLESIDLFHQQVLACEHMRWIQSAADLDACIADGKIGALLSLEGVDALQGRLSLLRILFRLGVRAAGLTWNGANWAADGVMEPRGGGLTAAGREFVMECNRLGILLDVSHLSERGFWELADMAVKPLIASHSNARAICDHPRNLTDDQIRGIIAMDGRIGVTYVPWFVSNKEVVTIDDLLLHIDHICGLGGQSHLMLGSDFDGIDSYIERLKHPGQVAALREELLKRYTEKETDNFLFGNALRYLKNQLPRG